MRCIVNVILRKVVHMENVKMIFNLENFIKQVPCKECGKPLRKVMNTKLQWMRENIFLKRNS